MRALYLGTVFSRTLVSSLEANLRDSARRWEHKGRWSAVVGHLKALAPSLRSSGKVYRELLPVGSANRELLLSNPRSALAAFKGLLWASLMSAFFWEFVIFLFIWRRP
jgi:hypothetical protein